MIIVNGIEVGWYNCIVFALVCIILSSLIADAQLNKKKTTEKGVSGRNVVQTKKDKILVNNFFFLISDDVTRSEFPVTEIMWATNLFC